MKEDWIECKLGEVMKVSSGKGLTAKKMDGGKFPVYGGNGITGYHSEKIFDEPKLIIGRVGVRCGVTHITKKEAWVTDNALIVNFKSNDFDLRFMKLKLQFENLNKLSNSTAQPVISGAKIYSYKILLPPLLEQQAIVHKIETLFSSLDSGIADLKKAQEQLNIYRQAVLKKAFEGELTNTKFERKSISEIGEILTGNTPSKKKEENYSSRDYNFYKPTDLEVGENVVTSNDFLSKVGFENSRQVPENSILVTCIGATIGKTGLIKKQGGFNQQINAIVPFENYEPKFIYYQAIGIDFQNKIKTNASSTTLPILNKGKFSKLLMNVCTPKGQLQIVQEIESRLSVCDAVEQNIIESLEKAQALRQSILKKAFEGKLLTQEELTTCKAHPEYEPASMLLAKIKKDKLNKL